MLPDPGQPPENGPVMSLIFLCYLLTFVLILKGKRRPAYLLLGVCTILSLAMFWYHTNSSLDLNF